MKLSCTSTMVPGGSITEKAKRLRDWGYEGIAVFAEYSTWNDQLYQELLHLEENTGVRTCEFVFGDEIYGHLMDPNEELQKESRKMYKLAAQICAKLGAVTELEFSYGPRNPLPLFDPYMQMSERQEREFLEMYREVAAPLANTEGYMLLEGINRYESPYLNRLKDCKDIVDKTGIKRAGVLADFFHMAIEEADFTESIRHAGSSIKHVHLGDNNRLLPGYGMIDWKKCFTALQEIGYQGFLNLECSTCGNPEETLPKTAVYLKSMI
ncbi:xylose isomerase [Bacteroidia bacterium]|nr:xylose isomerase [Bacteroidia bacterium]